MCARQTVLAVDRAAGRADEEETAPEEAHQRRKAHRFGGVRQGRRRQVDDCR